MPRGEVRGLGRKHAVIHLSHEIEPGTRKRQTDEVAFDVELPSADVSQESGLSVWTSDDIHAEGRNVEPPSTPPLRPKRSHSSGVVSSPPKHQRLAPLAGASPPKKAVSAVLVGCPAADATQAVQPLKMQRSTAACAGGVADSARLGAEAVPISRSNDDQGPLLREERGDRLRETTSGRSETAPGGCRIRVSPIPRTLDWRYIKAIFDASGHVVRCDLDCRTAFVTFELPSEATKAARTFDGSKLNGQVIHGSFHQKEKTREQQRSGGRRT